MNSKLIKALIVSAFIFLLVSTQPAFSQTPAPSASPTPASQLQDMNQMAGMDKMSDSVTKMSEMCMAMMEKEKAMMPLIIAVSAIFELLVFIALLLGEPEMLSYDQLQRALGRLIHGEEGDARNPEGGGGNGRVARGCGAVS